MTQEKEIQPRPWRSIETTLLIRKLLTMGINERISYSELQLSAGMANPPSSNNALEYGKLDSARKHLSGRGINFAPYRDPDSGSSGIYRLSEKEAVGQKATRIGNLGKQGGRIAREAAALDIDAMDPSSKIRIYGVITQARMTQAINSHKGTARLLDEMEKVGPKIFTPGETIKMFESQRAAGKV